MKNNYEDYSGYKTVINKIVSFVREVGSQKEAAKRFGISEQYLSDILRGKRDIPDGVLAGLRYKRVITFVALKTDDPAAICANCGLEQYRHGFHTEVKDDKYACDLFIPKPIL